MSGLNGEDWEAQSGSYISCILCRGSSALQKCIESYSYICCTDQNRPSCHWSVFLRLSTERLQFGHFVNRKTKLWSMVPIYKSCCGILRTSVGGEMQLGNILRDKSRWALAAIAYQWPNQEVRIKYNNNNRHIDCGLTSIYKEMENKC